MEWERGGWGVGLEGVEGYLGIPLTSPNKVWLCEHDVAFLAVLLCSGFDFGSIHASARPQLWWGVAPPGLSL